MWLIIDELDTYNSFDYLQIIDGYYVEQWFTLATFSGGLPSTKVYSSTVNLMTLRFVTNSGDSKKGFELILILNQGLQFHYTKHCNQYSNLNSSVYKNHNFCHFSNCDYSENIHHNINQDFNCAEHYNVL